MKDDETKIERIELMVAGKPLSITLEQARGLRDVLNEMFPEPTEPAFQPFYPITVIHPVVIERERPQWQPWNPWEVTYGATSVSLSTQ